MDTTENNKLIAEFMGLEYAPKDKRWDDWFTKDGTRVTFRSRIPLQYHASWDWLMPVVEKIEYCDGISNDEVITIEYKDCIIPHHQGEVRIEGANSKLEAVYQAVVEFIKCYNQKKED